MATTPNRSEDLGTAFRLDGKRAIITGGTSGLGLAMAQSLSEAGASIVAVSRSGAENLSGIEGAVHYAHDITETEGAETLIERIVAEQGPVDILINNAGSHCKKPVEDMSVAEFSGVLDVHLVGAFSLTSALVPHFKERGTGSVLFIASMTSFMGMPMVAGYAAAKAGYLGLVRSLAVELGPAGVRVNGIAPGWIDTPMFRQATHGDPERRAKILGRTPLGRFGDPNDIGNAAVYLSSDAARFIHGVVLPVDGGALIGF